MTKKWTVTLEVWDAYPTEFHSGLIRQASRIVGRDEGLTPMDVETAIMIMIVKGVRSQGLEVSNKHIRIEPKE